MLRSALLIAALPAAALPTALLVAPNTGFAAELWCMPDTLCDAKGCDPTDDEEMSVRLQDLEAGKTTLRTHAEDVAMTRSGEGDIIQWRGANDFGGTEILAWRQSDGAFTYLIRWDDGETSATGQCEVQ